MLLKIKVQTHNLSALGSKHPHPYIETPRPLRVKHVSIWFSAFDPHHTTPIKYRGSIKKSNRITPHTLGPLHTRNWRPVTIAFWDLSWIEKAKTVQIHFTLEGEDPSTQQNYHRWMVSMNFCMAYYNWCFIVCQNLRQTHLQESRPNANSNKPW